jgi:hypothetical protein
MNKLFFYVFLFSLLLTSSCSLFEAPVCIKGKISNFAEYETKDAVIQLVPLSPKEEFSVKAVTSVRGLGGKLIGIEYSSDFPKQSASKSFNYKLESIKPGKYVLAIHTVRPKVSPGGDYKGPTLGRLLASSDYRIIVFEISEDVKLPISFDLSEVTIPSSDRVIIAEFKNAKILKH